MELVEEFAVVQAREQYLDKDPRELNLIFLMMSEVSMLLLPSVARQLPILDVT
jgi:hypothetical protein